MVPEKSFVGVRIPYSDLTGTLDPHNVYETRAKFRATEVSNGLERFAYMVFGPNFIGSLAFALNPYVAYEFPTMRITPTNRTRFIPSISRNTRRYEARTIDHICQNQPDGSTPSLTDFTAVSCTTATTAQSSGTFQDQLFYRGFVADTTNRTRPLNSKGGEFELFSPSFHAPGRSSSAVFHDRLIAFPNGQPDNVQFYERIRTVSSNLIGPDIRVAPAEVDKLLVGERTVFPGLVGKHGLGLLADSLPTSRTFSLFRSVAELKDLPMLYRNALELYKDSSKLLTLKGQGNQFLNLEFGWKPLYKDICDMLKLPEQITKEVNRLIDRNGQPTVFRAKRKGSEQIGSLPTFAGNSLPEESYEGGSVTGLREWELRTAITYTLRFPQVDIPLLRQDLLDAKWGTNPNPTDVYNLVPWTWLVDWFSGLNQYVDVMNTLASDRNLFNYGYLTYVSNGKVNVSDTRSRFNKRTAGTIGPDSYVEELLTKRSVATNVLSYKYQRRIDISTLGDVVALSRPSTLRTDQYAILGALLAKFASS